MLRMFFDWIRRGTRDAIIQGLEDAEVILSSDDPESVGLHEFAGRLAAITGGAEAQPAGLIEAGPRQKKKA